MALLANPTVRTVVQVVLTVVILVLAYVLYETIAGPQREFLREQRITEISRERMDHLRRALITFDRRYRGYPPTLDSLLQVIRTDSYFVARRDSIFGLAPGQTIDLDSLIYSSRGPRFEYVAVRDDTLNVWVYLLRDPVTGDSIGTADPARATGLRNAASWE